MLEGNLTYRDSKPCCLGLFVLDVTCSEVLSTKNLPSQAHGEVTRARMWVSRLDPAGEDGDSPTVLCCGGHRRSGDRFLGSGLTPPLMFGNSRGQN